MNTLTDRKRRLAGIPKDEPLADEVPDMVWVVVGDGRKRLVSREQAKADGLTLDTSKPRGFGANGFGGANYRLSVEEKKRLNLQTGQNFDDHAQYKAWCRATGKRDVERGEPQDVVRKDMDGWYRDTGGQGPAPHDWKTAKGGRKPIPRPWLEGE